jgi:hypothetical protein
VAQEIILRNVSIGVADMPDGGRAVAFLEDNGNVVLVPMSDDNFNRLAAQWKGLVVAHSTPAMAASIKNGRN